MVTYTATQNWDAGPGASAGSAVTAASTAGAGQSSFSVSASAPTYTATAYAGALAVKMAPAGAIQWLSRNVGGSTTPSRWAMREHFAFQDGAGGTSNPATTAVMLWELRWFSGAVGSVSLDGAGNIVWRGATGAIKLTVPLPTIAAGAWFRVELAIDWTTYNAGYPVTLAVFTNNTSLTPAASGTANDTTVGHPDTDSTQGFNTVYLGSLLNAQTATYLRDDWAVTSSQPYGYMGAASAPNVSYAAKQTGSGTSAVTNGKASVPATPATAGAGTTTIGPPTAAASGSVARAGSGTTVAGATGPAVTAAVASTGDGATTVDGSAWLDAEDSSPGDGWVGFGLDGYAVFGADDQPTGEVQLNLWANTGNDGSTLEDGTVLHAPTSVALQVSADGGDTWTTVGTVHPVADGGYSTYTDWRPAGGLLLYRAALDGVGGTLAVAHHDPAYPADDQPAAEVDLRPRWFGVDPTSTLELVSYSPRRLRLTVTFPEPSDPHRELPTAPFPVSVYANHAGEQYFLFGPRAIPASLTWTLAGYPDSSTLTVAGITATDLPGLVAALNADAGFAAVAVASYAADPETGNTETVTVRTRDGRGILLDADSTAALVQDAGFVGYGSGGAFQVDAGGTLLAGTVGTQVIELTAAELPALTDAASVALHGDWTTAHRPWGASFGLADFTRPRITTTALPPAIVGEPYHFQLAAVGPAVVGWETMLLPAWLTLSDDGLLSGTPTAVADPDGVYFLAHTALGTGALGSLSVAVVDRTDFAGDGTSSGSGTASVGGATPAAGGSVARDGEGTAVVAMSTNAAVAPVTAGEGTTVVTGSGTVVGGVSRTGSGATAVADATLTPAAVDVGRAGTGTASVGGAAPAASAAALTDGEGTTSVIGTGGSLGFATATGEGSTLATAFDLLLRGAGASGGEGHTVVGGRGAATPLIAGPDRIGYAVGTPVDVPVVTTGLVSLALIGAPAWLAVSTAPTGWRLIGTPAEGGSGAARLLGVGADGTVVEHPLALVDETPKGGGMDPEEHPIPRTLEVPDSSLGRAWVGYDYAAELHSNDPGAVWGIAGASLPANFELAGAAITGRAEPDQVGSHVVHVRCTGADGQVVVRDMTLEVAQP